MPLRWRFCWSFLTHARVSTLRIVVNMYLLIVFVAVMMEHKVNAQYLFNTTLSSSQNATTTFGSTASRSITLDRLTVNNCNVTINLPAMNATKKLIVSITQSTFTNQSSLIILGFPISTSSTISPSSTSPAGTFGGLSLKLVQCTFTGGSGVAFMNFFPPSTSMAITNVTINLSSPVPALLALPGLAIPPAPFDTMGVTAMIVGFAFVALQVAQAHVVLSDVNITCINSGTGNAVACVPMAVVGVTTLRDLSAVEINDCNFTCSATAGFAAGLLFSKSLVITNYSSLLLGSGLLDGGQARVGAALVFGGSNASDAVIVSNYSALLFITMSLQYSGTSNNGILSAVPLSASNFGWVTILNCDLQCSSGTSCRQPVIDVTTGPWTWKGNGSYLSFTRNRAVGGNSSRSKVMVAGTMAAVVDPLMSSTWGSVLIECNFVRSVQIQSVANLTTYFPDLLPSTPTAQLAVVSCSNESSAPCYANNVYSMCFTPFTIDSFNEVTSTNGSLCACVCSVNNTRRCLAPPSQLILNTTGGAIGARTTTTTTTATQTASSTTSTAPTTVATTNAPTSTSFQPTTTTTTTTSTTMVQSSAPTTTAATMPSTVPITTTTSTTSITGTAQPTTSPLGTTSMPPTTTGYPLASSTTSYAPITTAPAPPVSTAAPPSSTPSSGPIKTSSHRVSPSKSLSVSLSSSTILVAVTETAPFLSFGTSTLEAIRVDTTRYRYHRRRLLEHGLCLGIDLSFHQI